MPVRTGVTTASDRGPWPHPAADPSRFFRRWLGFVTLGEGAGFAMAAAAGVASAVLQPSPALAYAVVIAAGAIEGGLLGVGQLLALRALRLESSVLRRWPVLTSLGAVVAWAIGLLPSTLPDLDWSSPLVWVGAGLLGLVLLAAIPLAQLILLRRMVLRPWRWLPANILGWLLGIGWTLVVSPLVDSSTPIPQLLILYVVAGVLMALTVAAATGLCWTSWIRHGDLIQTASTPSPASQPEGQRGGDM
ncbi:MAG TPA: hypothetical protein VIT42_04895 [Microlunatus sp.]